MSNGTPVRALSFFVLYLVTLFPQTAVAERPNLVLILADDLTWRDIGCYGNAEVRTPNIDRLAAEGVRFTQAFTATAMCSPTRQQLYTGVFPVRNGAYPNHSRVKQGTRSLVHHLGKLGYRVGLKGKKHIGPKQSFPFKGVKNVAEFVTDSAGPYCLVFASHQPHLPWKKEAGFDPDELTVPPYLVDTPETRRGLAKYYTDIADLDREVGEVLKAVERTGRADDTLVLFTSEQGAQWPFAKWTCYDLGLRVALVVRWPSRVEAGTSTDALVRYVDVLPTLIEAAGGGPSDFDTGLPGAPDGGRGFDGRSFLPVLEGRADAHADFTYGVQTTLGIIAGKPYPIRSIRDTRYKYIMNLLPEAAFHNTVIAHDGAGYWRSWVRKAETDEKAARRVRKYQRRPAEEFYDLRTDPFEMHNLADRPEYRERMDRMRAKLEEWMRQQGDRGVPTERAAKERRNRRR